MNKKVTKKKLEKDPVIELLIQPDDPSSGVSAIALVDEPAIEKYWIAMNNHEEFVTPKKGEKEKDFIPRCVAVQVGEGKDQDQAVAICYSVWGQKHSSEEFKDYPWDQCIADAKKRGLDEESANKLCGWIRWNGSKFDIDPSGLPPYVDPGVKPKKKMAVPIEPTGTPKGTKGGPKNNPVNPTPNGTGKIRRIFNEDSRHELKSMVAQHNETYTLPHQKADYQTLKQVYNRAASSLEMEEKHSAYTIRQAGILRCKHFLHMLAKCKYATKAYQGMDNDLLPDGHRLKGVKSKRKMFATEDDKKILVGPAMIPDFKIYRKDENGNSYYVNFSRATIFKIQQKFMRELRNRDTNLQHHDLQYGHAYVFESWTVEDPEKDKANLIYNLNVPVGTWMVAMQVTSDKVWNDVKSGKYKGFSIEGEFMDGNSYDIEVKDEKEAKDLYEKLKKILEKI